MKLLLTTCSKFGKLSSGLKLGKGQFPFQSQRKAMPKTVQTTAQFHSFWQGSKVMLKILQARLQQYLNWELLDVQAGFRKGRGIRYQIDNINWIIEKAREFQKKNICFIDYAKAFDFWREQLCLCSGSDLHNLSLSRRLLWRWSHAVEWLLTGKSVTDS